MREARIDRVRGLAIVLMVIDHVLLFTDADSFIRHTLTRAALPLFCVVAGCLRDRVRWSRIGEITFWGALLSVPGVGVATPDILLLLAPALVVAALWPSPWLIVIGLVTAYSELVSSALSWAGWSGYQPGYVLALVMSARLMYGLFWPGLLRIGSALPGWLSFPGRYPLSIYVGHIAVLRGVVYVNLA